jgi:hypothetical protein
MIADTPTLVMVGSGPSYGTAVHGQVAYYERLVSLLIFSPNGKSCRSTSVRR